MRNALSLYIDDSPGSTEEVNRLIEEMEETARSTFSEDELEWIYENSSSFRAHRRLVTNLAIESVTEYSAEHISNIRNGQSDVNHRFILILRLLHEKVMDDPDLIRAAIMDWMEREENAREPAF